MNKSKKNYSQCNDCFDHEHCKGKIKGCQCYCVSDRKERINTKQTTEKVLEEFNNLFIGDLSDVNGGGDRMYKLLQPIKIKYFLKQNLQQKDKEIKQAKAEERERIVEILNKIKRKEYTDTITSDEIVEVEEFINLIKTPNK